MEELGTSQSGGIAARLKPETAGTGLVPGVPPCRQN